MTNNPIFPSAKNHSPKNNQVLTAVILAGGLGTRLSAVVKDVPKPMADVHGRPFLEFILDHLISQKITTVIISIGYLGAIIKSHFGTKYKNLEIKYIEEQTPLGTGGAIKRVIQSAIITEKTFILLNGDTYFNFDKFALQDCMLRTNADIVVSLKNQSGERYSNVELDSQSKIIGFNVNDGSSTLINCGTYILDVSNVKKILAKFGQTFSFENSVLINKGEKLKIYGLIEESTFFDIGVPVDYQRFVNFAYLKQIRE